MRAIRGLSLLTALALCASPATGQTAAEKYGSHMGLDIAFAPENTAVYVQVGSAWARP